MLKMTDLERALFLNKTIKKLLYDRDITITEIAKRLNISQPYITQNLNWRRFPDDNFYENILKAIPKSE